MSFIRAVHYFSWQPGKILSVKLKQTGVKTKLKGRCRMTESKFAHISDTDDLKHNYLRHNYSQTMAVIQCKNTGGQTYLWVKASCNPYRLWPIFYTIDCNYSVHWDLHVQRMLPCTSWREVNLFISQMNKTWLRHPGHRGMRQQTHSISSQQPAAKGLWTRAKTGRGALSYEQHGWQSCGRALTALFTCPRRRHN